MASRHATEDRMVKRDFGLNDDKNEKPVVFISHATSDKEFANAVKQEIEKVFANGVSVFCTSSPGAIPAGNDWLSEIEQRLAVTQAIIVIITPVSIERPWLWFEVGASWSKSKADQCHIYPLCAPEVDISSLPAPLDRLQALSMGKAIDLKLLFEALSKQFDFGKISSFRSSNITKRIPKYRDVKIADLDLNDRTFYSGRYADYSDEELMEVIDSEFFQPDHQKYLDDDYGAFFRNREDLIQNGKLIQFRQLDQALDLPKGTAKRLLNKIAARYEMKPILETDNVVRYSVERDSDDY